MGGKGRVYTSEFERLGGLKGTKWWKQNWILPSWEWGQYHGISSSEFVLPPQEKATCRAGISCPPGPLLITADSKQVLEKPSPSSCLQIPRQQVEPACPFLLLTADGSCHHVLFSRCQGPVIGVVAEGLQTPTLCITDWGIILLDDHPWGGVKVLSSLQSYSSGASSSQLTGSESGTGGSCSCLTMFSLLLFPQQLQQRSAENLISDMNVAVYWILIRKC